MNILSTLDAAYSIHIIWSIFDLGYWVFVFYYRCDIIETANAAAKQTAAERISSAASDLQLQV
jgi:hypothetical protein